MAGETQGEDIAGLQYREDMTLLIRSLSPGRGREQGRGQAKTLTRRSIPAPPPRPTRSSTTTESSGPYLPQGGKELPLNEHGRIGDSFHFDLRLKIKVVVLDIMKKLKFPCFQLKT